MNEVATGQAGEWVGLEVLSLFCVVMGYLITTCMASDARARQLKILCHLIGGTLLLFSVVLAFGAGVSWSSPGRMGHEVAPSLKFDAGSAMYLVTVSEEVVQYDFSSGGVVSWGDKSYVALKMHESPFEPRAREMIDGLVAELKKTIGRDIVHVDYYGEDPDKPYLDGIIVTWGAPLELSDKVSVEIVPSELREEGLSDTVTIAAETGGN